MALKTQGTKIYIIDPEGTNAGDILQIACATSANMGGAPRDQHDSTCLESDAATYEAGLAKPGTMTLGLNFDPSSESHIRLNELFKSGTKFDMAVGLSDGTAAADLDTDGAFDLPSTRTWVVHHGVYVADYPLDIALNALVTAQVPFQKSGFFDIFPKSS